MDSVMFLALALIGYRQLTYGASLSNTEVKPLASFNPVQPPATNTPPSYVYKCGGPLANITDYDCQTTENETVLGACYYNGFDNYFSCPQLCEGATRKEKRGMKCRAFCGGYRDDYCLLEPLLPATVTVSRPINPVSLPTLQPAYTVSRISVGNPASVSKQDGGLSAGLPIGAICLLAIVIVAVVARTRSARRPGFAVRYNGDGVDLGVGPIEDEDVRPIEDEDVRPIEDGGVRPIEDEDVRPIADEDVSPSTPMLPTPVQEEENPNDFTGEGNTQPRAHKSDVI